MTKLRSGDTVELAWAMGRHSLIPDCCIRFYIGDWQNFSNEEKWAWPGRNGYIRCPECIKNGNIVEIHLCSPECRDRIKRGVG